MLEMNDNDYTTRRAMVMEIVTSLVYHLKASFEGFIAFCNSNRATIASCCLRSKDFFEHDSDFQHSANAIFLIMEATVTRS